MEAEVNADLNVMDRATDWVQALWGRAKTASSAPWLNRQSRSVEESATPVKPTTPANLVPSPAIPVNPISSPATPVTPVCIEIALLSLIGPSPFYSLNDVD
jgi:hypothetical protein